MTTTRRSFFRLVAGAAALVAVPMPALSKAETIWCDGVNDDGPGITALLRGEAVRFRDPSMAERIGWKSKWRLALDGKFTIRTPIIVDHTFKGKVITGGAYDHIDTTAVHVRTSAPDIAFHDMKFSQVSEKPTGASRGETRALTIFRRRAPTVHYG